jgi:Predicted periplasmic lipoprotein (DUF2279)
MGGSLLLLNGVWYAQYPKEPFHFFNDAEEWAQMDKAGHIWSAYTLTSLGQRALRWSGMPPGPSTTWSAAAAFAYLAGIEWLDGYSSGWGFSGWDMAANAVGAGVFLGQERAWGEQRVLLKYSAHLTNYAVQRPELLGDGVAERLLKDYNGATLWASANLGALGMGKPCPVWLNVSLGYGAEGMLSARSGEAIKGNSGAHGFARSAYLALDVDLGRIPTHSKALHTVLVVLNCIKVPAPALELRQGRGLVFHGVYF